MLTGVLPDEALAQSHYRGVIWMVIMTFTLLQAYVEYKLKQLGGVVGF